MKRVTTRSSTRFRVFRSEFAILRTYAAFLAGTGRMRWRKFLPANAAAGIVWAGIYTLIAYFAGNTLQRTESGIVDLVIVGVAVLSVASVLFFVRRKLLCWIFRPKLPTPGLDGHVMWVGVGTSGSHYYFSRPLHAEGEVEVENGADPVRVAAAV